MKKSNKILVTGFLTIVFLVLAIHTVWLSKYKSGKYQVVNFENDPEVGMLRSFPDVTVVSLLNINEATVSFSDVAKVERNNAFTVTRQGDTLVITGTRGQNQPALYPAPRISLPYAAKLTASNSFVTITASKDAIARKHDLALVGSGVTLQGDFGSSVFSVTATDSSIAAFKPSARLKDINIQLSNSTFSYEAERVGTITILTDSLSRISLPYKHLATASITMGTGTQLPGKQD